MRYPQSAQYVGIQAGMSDFCALVGKKTRKISASKIARKEPLEKNIKAIRNYLLKHGSGTTAEIADCLCMGKSTIYFAITAMPDVTHIKRGKTFIYKLHPDCSQA